MQKPEAPPAPPKIELERAKDDDSGSTTDTEDEREEDDDPATLASALSAAVLASPPMSPRFIEMAAGDIHGGSVASSQSMALPTGTQLSSAFSLATQAASNAGPASAVFSAAQVAKLHRPRTFSFTGT
jgi:hypothetical protein